MSDNNLLAPKKPIFSSLNVGILACIVIIPIILYTSRIVFRVQRLIPSAFKSLKLPVICIMIGPVALQIINVASIFIPV